MQQPLSSQTFSTFTSETGNLRLGEERAKWNEVEEVETGNSPQGWEL